LRLFSHPVTNPQRLSLLDSLLGAAVGAGFFYVSWALYYLVRKKHGLGFGDIALMAMSGAFLGLKLVLLVIFAAPLLGVLYGVVLLSQEALARSSDDKADAAVKQPFLSREIPFGVLLGACALFAAFVGQRIWSWYLGRF
jgi:leader peptidase (prepilin peptidase)/N-methyltransferase